MRNPRLLFGLTLAALLTSSAVIAQDQVLNMLAGATPGTPFAKILDDVNAAFEKQTGVPVKLTIATDETPEVYETSVIGGKEADVVMVNLNEGSLDWLKNGIVVPVGDYLDQWDLRKRINPDAVAQWTNADGQISGFPYNGFVWPVWYNTDLLKKAGIDSVPMTTDELIADAGKLRAAGIGPIVVGGNDWSGQKMFLQIVQSYLSPDEAKSVFASGKFCGTDNAKKGVELFVKLRDAGVFVDDVEGYTADQMNATFFEGKAAIMPAGSWAFSSDGAKGMNIQLSGMPVPEGGTYSKPTAFNGYTGGGFWISNNGAKKIDLVKQYISLWYDNAIVARTIAEGAAPSAALLSGPADIPNPLLAYASTDLLKNVNFAVMPDAYVPGPVANPMIRQTSVAFAPGTDAQAICDGLESAYAQ